MSRGRSNISSVNRNCAKPAIIITCEHASNHLPAEYRDWFHGAGRVLASHRGWDPGAIDLARSLAVAWRAPLFRGTVTRLLVELNRSPHHRDLFSKFSRAATPKERESLLQRYYRPYQRRIEKCITQSLRSAPWVCHLSVHSFTPELHGVHRKVDVGLLFDPRRSEETTLCHAWARRLATADPNLRIRFNEPYRGWEDGLTTCLRTRFPAAHYRGIEIEINQAIPTGNPATWEILKKNILSSFPHLRSQDDGNL